VADEAPGASGRLGGARSDSLRHHDLCFGCGQANLFGLQLELTRSGEGVEGRFFVKQDHQGPDGNAHPGVLATALEEALSLAGAPAGGRVELEFLAPAPVGTFVRVSARAGVAEALGEDGRRLASAERRA
jgi:acyl-coenzyme A thioesterase PaaI-like protein